MHLQLLRVCILVPVVKGFWYYFPMQFKRHTLHVFIFRTQIWSRIELSVAQASRQISLSSKALAINRDTLPIKRGVVMIYTNCSFLEQQMNCGLSVLQSSMSGFLRVSYILHSVRKWISSSTFYRGTRGKYAALCLQAWVSHAYQSQSSVCGLII